MHNGFHVKAQNFATPIGDKEDNKVRLIWWDWI